MLGGNYNAENEMNPNERLQGESYAAYKVRRAEANIRRNPKQRLRLLWNSAKGTYVRAKHGPLRPAARCMAA